VESVAIAQAQLGDLFFERTFHVSVGYCRLINNSSSCRVEPDAEKHHASRGAPAGKTFHWRILLGHAGQPQGQGREGAKDHQAQHVDGNEGHGSPADATARRRAAARNGDIGRERLDGWLMIRGKFHPHSVEPLDFLELGVVGAALEYYVIVKR
jgi:hypothetical protein